MTDQVTRLRQEAEERYPLDRRQVMFSGEPFPRPEQAAFIAGRTVSPERVEQAAEGMFLWDTEEHPEPKPTWKLLTEEQRGIPEDHPDAQRIREAE